jgi:hypothetical protein
MRWTHALTTIAFAAIAASSATAQSPPPAKLVWQKTPNAEDVRRVFPPAALQKGIAGGAMVGCDVAADGQLLHCMAYAEEPANMGFGQAGVDLAAQFQLKPGTFDHALPIPGRIALPMILSPPNHVRPKLGFKLGDTAMLLGNADFPRDASAVNRLGCLTAEPPHRCSIHFLTWAASPNAMAALASTLKAGSTTGGDVLLCWVGPGGGLTDCQSSSPAARVIADDLAPTFKAPANADDRTPIGAGPIMITLNWAPLSAAAQALKPESATGPAPVTTGQ